MTKHSQKLLRSSIYIGLALLMIIIGFTAICKDIYANTDLVMTMSIFTILFAPVLSYYFMDNTFRLSRIVPNTTNIYIKRSYIISVIIIFLLIAITLFLNVREISSKIMHRDDIAIIIKTIYDYRILWILLVLSQIINRILLAFITTIKKG